MDLTMMQKKKHLLLLNRIMRAELKKDIIPVPSKLTEEEVNQYFNKLFVKKTEGSDNYYIPIKNKLEIPIDEELFKEVIKKPKTKEEKQQEKAIEKDKNKEIEGHIINSLYNKFANDFVKPYVTKKRAGEDFKEEEKKLIERYIKIGSNVKQFIKMQLPKMWEGLLNPAFLEREKRKEVLKEEDKKLMKSIRKESKK